MVTRRPGTEFGGGGEALSDARDADPYLSGESLFALLELVPLGVLLWYDEHALVNRRGGELTGLAPGRVLHHDGVLPFTFAVDGRELSSESDPIRRAAAEGAVTRDEALRLLRADGTHADVRLSAWPMTGPDGRPAGAVVALAEPAAATPAEDAMERIEHLASLGTLAASVAHEINNPLNSIMVNAELGLIALDKSGDQAKVRQVLETIVRDVKRCGSITHGVLQLSKATDTEWHFHDLNEVIRQAQQLVAAYFRMHDAVLKLELEDLPPVRMNPTIMEHAIVNLLRNAAEAADKGVHVYLRTRATGDAVTLTVRDDGPGIAPEHLDHVFKPLFSTNRHRHGTGLGLSLVHRTVKEHGGTIHVHSTLGEGTIFGIELPLEGAEKTGHGPRADR